MRNFICRCEKDFYLVNDARLSEVADDRPAVEGRVMSDESKGVGGSHLSREPGWYWVQRYEGSGETPSRWDGYRWYVSGAEYTLQDNELHWIGPRIPSFREPPLAPPSEGAAAEVWAAIGAASEGGE